MRCRRCSRADVAPSRTPKSCLRHVKGASCPESLRARFSDVFGFSLDAIKHWEGGRRTPEAPARTLLTVIDKNPAAVLTAASAGGLRCFHRIFQDPYCSVQDHKEDSQERPLWLQELLSMEIAPIGRTHYSACRHSSMNAQRWLPLPEPCLPLSSRCFRNIRISRVVEGESAEFCRG